MRQILSILTFAIIMMCKVGHAVTYDTFTNFILNGDAENIANFSAWNHSVGATEVNDNGFLAVGSQCFNVPNGNYINASHFAINGGIYYQCRFNYKSTSETTGWIWGLLRYFDASGQFIGQNWLKLQATNGKWQYAVITDSLSPASAAKADVAFFGDGTTMNSYSGAFRFDNVQVYRQGGIGAEPPNNASNVNMYTKLSWDSNISDSAYDLYLGTDQNSVANASHNSDEFIDTITNYATKIKYAVNLRPYTTYYWRVDRIAEDSAITTGQVYAFTTWLELAENIRDATAKRYCVRDDENYTMDCLKIIKRPDAAGYFGVYHSYIYKPAINKSEFDARLATSTDLLNWTYVTTLVSNGDMPYIVYHQPTGCYFLAHEQWIYPGSTAPCRLGFKRYSSVYNLLAATPDRSFLAPLTLGGSSSLEGTPNIYSIDATGNQIEVGFHYYDNNYKADLNGRGRLLNLLNTSPTWTAWNETSRNSNLTVKGFNDIGARDDWFLCGDEYLLQEASKLDWNNPNQYWYEWRIWMWDYARNNFYKLSPVTDLGSISIGKPTATKLTSPSGKPAVAVTYFIFSQGSAAGEAGPVVFYTELATAASEPVPTNLQQNVMRNTKLRWLAGQGVATHDVYVGTNANTVSSANHSSPEYMGYTTKPCVAPPVLKGNTSYFWRVDEVDSDGSLTVGSLWQFATKAAILGDLDGNDSVNFADLGMLSSYWLTSDQTSCPGDLNGDCKVDLADFALLAGNWNMY